MNKVYKVYVLQSNKRAKVVLTTTDYRQAVAEQQQQISLSNEAFIWEV